MFGVYSGRDCTCHLNIILLVWGCCSGTDECRLYLECRLLDMRTGAPAVIYTPDSGCSFTSGYEPTVKTSRR